MTNELGKIIGEINGIFFERGIEKAIRIQYLSEDSVAIGICANEDGLPFRKELKKSEASAYLFGLKLGLLLQEGKKTI